MSDDLKPIPYPDVTPTNPARLQPVTAATEEASLMLKPAAGGWAPSEAKSWLLAIGAGAFSSVGAYLVMPEGDIRPTKLLGLALVGAAGVVMTKLGLASAGTRKL